MAEERPSVTTLSSKDSKVVFLTSMMTLCWQQAPQNRPSFKNLLGQIRIMMEQEPRPITTFTPFVIHE